MFLMLMMNLAVVYAITQDELADFLAKKENLKKEQIISNADGSVSYKDKGLETFRASILDESKLIQIITFDSSSVENERHLKCETYDENGKRRSYMKYENGKKKEYTEWNEAGKITFFCEFDKDGNEISREEKSYHENGKIRSQVFYENRKKTKYLEFNENGNDILIVTFRDGNEFGRTETTYHENGNPKSYMRYEKGKKKEYKEWNAAGKTVFCLIRDVNGKQLQKIQSVYDSTGTKILKNIHQAEEGSSVFESEVLYYEGKKSEDMAKISFSENGIIFKIRFDRFYFKQLSHEEREELDKLKSNGVKIEVEIYLC